MSEITTRRSESGSFVDLSAEDRGGEKRKITPEQRKEEEAMVREYLNRSHAVRMCTDAYSERQTKLIQKHGLDYPADDEELEELDKKMIKAYERQEELTPAIIRANLYRFDLEDTDVTTELEERNSERRIATLMEPEPLSNFCGMKFHEIAQRLGIDIGTIKFAVYVKREDKEIGRIDSDGRFMYRSAPDLRTALGWSIATDGGRERIIDFFDLDKASQSILALIHEEGVSEKTFFGHYFKLLQTIFKYEQTSRFADGYCGAADDLWHVATRQLGNEHSGYNFVY